MAIKDTNISSEISSQDSAVTAEQVKSKARARKNSAANEAPSSTATTENVLRKKYSLTERAKLLASISKDLKNGDITVKAALAKVDISEQTYYNWKKASETKVQSVSAHPSNELKALVELEAENQRLRKVLAQKLHAENAELRKRLGL
ncbi:transposase [Brucella pituitosa]|uniref:Transposase n=1 Tax=Brucella pituitosa TaxID=571256 RepID=A0ABS3K2I2_9HYPH|nr:transposase [Brucella pituitosa]MBO1041128.1 transposase [Brucella pituitosa]